jgi:flagellar hook-associated protein 2
MADASATGLGSGTVTVEVGNGRLNKPTSLDFLNGQEGVRRGRIRITDRSGSSAVVDLRTALTVNDVLEAINEAEGVSVAASVSGDALTLTDQSGGTGLFMVEEVDGGSSAAGLGILAAVASETIQGRDLVSLADHTLLTQLNDGNGVGRLRGQDDLIIDVGQGAHQFAVNLDAGIRGDAADPATGTRLAQLNHGGGVELGVIRITDRAGNSAEIDLTAIDRGLDAGGLNQTTVQDVVNRMNETLAAEGVNVTVSQPSGNFAHLSLTDSTDLDTVPEARRSNLIVEDVSGSTAADLGIVADVDDDAFDGADVFRMDTLGDVVRAINYADGNGAGPLHVSATIDGKGLRLQAADVIQVEPGTEGSTAASDLGLLGLQGQDLQSRDLVAGLNTVLLRSLNGGAGVSGQLSIVARDGVGSVIVDVDQVQTVQELIDLINANAGATGLSARINAAANGIEIVDAGGGSGPLVISGEAADALGLAGSHEADTATANAQLQYVSAHTELSALNYGKGIARGQFRITNSRGVSGTVDLSQGNEVTLKDVIDEINSRPGLEVLARVNDQGDGLILLDQSGGDGRLRVEELGSTTAQDLNILGEAEEGEDFIDGSHEYRVDLTMGDTLNSLAAKIRDATRGKVNATVINDGSEVRPYRLTLASRIGGADGVLSFDTHQIGLETSTLVEARDAVLMLGGESAANGVLITSASNTVSNVATGVTINLLSPSDDTVTVTVEKDVDALVSDLKTFVQTYNDVIDRMAQQTSYNAETEERGILLGESTVSTVQSRLSNLVLLPLPGAPGGFEYAYAVGLSLGAGGRLTFDEEVFREAVAESPEQVEQLFTAEETGLAARLEEALDELTDSFDGLLTRRDETLGEREELLADRIDDLTVRLEARRAQLTAQFQAMERSLALLQSQQNALIGLNSLMTAAGTSLFSGQ